MNTGFRSINLFADNLDQLPCFVRDWNMFSFLDGNYLCYSVAWKIALRDKPGTISNRKLLKLLCSAKYIDRLYSRDIS